MPGFDRMHFLFTGILEVIRDEEDKPIDVKAKFRAASVRTPDTWSDPYLESPADIHDLLTKNTHKRTTPHSRAHLETAFHEIMDERAKLGLPELNLKIT